MKLRKTIKRIVALGTGAAMMGATVMGAMAADLNTYPSPFAKDGALNAIIVIGDEAKTSDMIGAVDIATSLQYDVKVKETVVGAGGGVKSLSGDNVKIEKSTNKLEINESVNSVMESVTSTDLKGLAGGSIDNEFGTFKYTQTVYLPEYALAQYVADPDDSSSVAKLYMKIPSGTEVYRYKISFTPAIKSDHNTAGTDYLEDIRNKKLTLFGKEYTILKMDHVSTSNIEMTLMGGAVSDTLTEGETVTHTIDGKDYEVKLDYVGSTEATFIVEGQTTDALQESETFRLTDGTEVGVVQIYAQEFAGGLRKVQFTLGADKIKIADTNTNATNLGTVSIGSTDMSSLQGDIKTATDGGTAHGTDVTISYIEFNYTAGTDIYIGEGDLASARCDLAEGDVGNFMSGAFDFRYEGLQIGNTETIEVAPSGSYNYKLKFTNKAGIEYNQDVIAYNQSEYRLGRYDGSVVKDLVVNESELIDDEEYFIISKNDYSRIMQFKKVTPGTSNTDWTGTLSVKDVGSLDTIDVTYTDLQGELILDGNTYLVNVSDDTSSAKLKVDLDGSGAFSTTTKSPELVTQYGARINLTIEGGTNVSATGFNITTEETENNVKDYISMTLSTSDNKIDLSDQAQIQCAGSACYHTTAMLINEDGSYKYGWYTKYGVYTEVDRIGSGNTQNKFTATYPDDQATVAFWVTVGDTSLSTTTSSEGTSEYYTINPIVSGMGVTAAKMASDVKDLTAQNIIVVGGPCVNSAAASLMGNPSPCWKDFTEGKAMVKLYENGDNLALLVAGYSAADTLRAAQVVANHDLYTTELTGEEVEVSGTSWETVTVAAPAPEEVATEGNETTTE